MELYKMIRRDLLIVIAVIVVLAIGYNVYDSYERSLTHTQAHEMMR